MVSIIKIGFLTRLFLYIYFALAAILLAPLYFICSKMDEGKVELFVETGKRTIIDRFYLLLVPIGLLLIIIEKNWLRRIIIFFAIICILFFYIKIEDWFLEVKSY